MSHSVHCHHCGLTVTLPKLTHRQKAFCPRCESLLTSQHRHRYERLIALACAALIMFAASLPFSFLSLRASGQQKTMDLGGGLDTLINQHYWLLALVQSVAIFAIPVTILGCLIYLAFPLLTNKPTPPHAQRVLSLVKRLLPWSMAEIFLIGTLVSLVKIASLADIKLGLSFYSYSLFAFFMVLTLLQFDEWQLRNDLGIPQPKPTSHPHSVQHTWALLAASCIAYIPANTQPIMTTRFLGSDDPATILGGVITLWHHGSYVIASIIFFASVFVPVAKIMVLAWLNYSLHSGQTRSQLSRMKWYRITEAIGRWSMIDVFVVAVLVGLIQLGNTMSIYPGPAALAFSGVVILTMLAAMSFDSKKIWQPND